VQQAVEGGLLAALLATRRLAQRASGERLDGAKFPQPRIPQRQQLFQRVVKVAFHLYRVSCLCLCQLQAEPENKLRENTRFSAN
jgi:hypothetical protein